MNSVEMVAVLFFGDVQCCFGDFRVFEWRETGKCSVVTTTSLAATKYYAPRIVLAYVTQNAPNYENECDHNV
jgi:hypothetical protein